MDVAPFPLGVVNPDGVVMIKLETPVTKGWKTTVVVSAPALMETGLLTMVPTLVFELVTATLTLKPVRMFWKDCAVRVVGLNWAEISVRVVSGEDAVVPKLADCHKIPDGVRVTVAVPSA